MRYRTTLTIGRGVIVRIVHAATDEAAATDAARLQPVPGVTVVRSTLQHNDFNLWRRNGKAFEHVGVVHVQELGVSGA